MDRKKASLLGRLAARRDSSCSNQNDDGAVDTHGDNDNDDDDDVHYSSDDQVRKGS